MQQDWDADKALKALEEETTVMDEGDSVKTAMRLFRESLPIAVNAITHLARYSPTEKIRLEASRYIVERNLGTLNQASPISETEDPIEVLLQDVRSAMQYTTPAGASSASEEAT